MPTGLAIGKQPAPSSLWRPFRFSRSGGPSTIRMDTSSNRWQARTVMTWERGSGSQALSVMLVVVGAVILLVPALLSGRPFIFYDTWEFHSWGRDVLAAIIHPWPTAEPFPAGRQLWASKVVSAPPAIVDETQFRLTLSTVGSRSAFYAVPIGALRSLWLAAGVQALLVSGILWVSVHAFGWRHHRLAFVGTVMALTVATTLPFFAAFLMPNLFTGLAALAAGL